MRDATARAIYLENKYGRGGPNGGAYIAVNHLPENIIDEWIREYSPAFLSRWKKIGIDIRRHAVEAGPGSHYTMGGVRVNENCETTVPRLFAAGEVGAGMDGAERIDGGPAITWCLTMGCVAGREASGAARDLAWPEIDYDQVEKEKKKIDALFDRETGVRGCEVKNKIKDIMWEYCAPGLSFREPCRQQVCGGCAVLINKKRVLACDALSEQEMVIEPIPRHRVLKDLIVDFSAEENRG